MNHVMIFIKYIWHCHRGGFIFYTQKWYPMVSLSISATLLRSIVFHEGVLPFH